MPYDNWLLYTMYRYKKERNTNMKRQIRLNVFETNSSSTHAICIAKDGYELKDHIDFHTGEYGWECEEYIDLDNKASYLITAILSMDKEYADEKLMQLKSILDDNDITYTIPELLNIKSYKYDGKTHRYYDIGDGYIDHVGELKSWLDDLLLDSDKLFRYLFGNSIIITGNDNDEFRDRMLIAEGEEETDWGTYTLYGDLKPEFDEYEIYEKGN